MSEKEMDTKIEKRTASAKRYDDSSKMTTVKGIIKDSCYGIAVGSSIVAIIVLVLC